jgi:hypothetical protein
MTQRESEQRRKITRRLFIQYTAATGGVALGAYAMTQKTDALAQTRSFIVDDNDGTISYPYK